MLFAGQNWWEIYIQLWRGFMREVYRIRVGRFHSGFVCTAELDDPVVAQPWEDESLITREIKDAVQGWRPESSLKCHCSEFALKKKLEKFQRLLQQKTHLLKRTGALWKNQKILLLYPFYSRQASRLLVDATQNPTRASLPFPVDLTPRQSSPQTN